MRAYRSAFLVAAAFLLGCTAVSTRSQREGRVVGSSAELLDLVESPDRLAIFPLENRTSSFAAGAVGLEALSTEAARSHLFDGARTAPVRDRLLLSGWNWTETAGDAEAARIAREIGAQAILVGSIDEWKASPNPTVSGTLRIRSVSGRILWVSSFTAEDRTLRNDLARDPPSSLVVKGIEMALGELSRAIEDEAELRDEGALAQIRKEAQEAGGSETLRPEERILLEEVLDGIESAPNPFYRLRRLGRAQRTVHDILIAVRYRQRLRDIQAARR